MKSFSLSLPIFLKYFFFEKCFDCERELSNDLFHNPLRDFCEASFEVQKLFFVLDFKDFFL
jgi:hypothetical protein